MRYIHFRDDFSIEEKFYTDDGNGGKVAIAVPERVEIEFFTVQGRTRFVARRNGSKFENCELSADGKTLTVFVSLRNKPIGHGRLLRLVTQISEDASFPDGLKYTRFPGREDAVLYLGKSDGPLDLTSEIVFGLGGVTLDRVWQSLQNNTDYPGEKIHLEHIPALPISEVIGLQNILDELSREIPSIDDFTIGIGDATISPGGHASLTEIGVPEWAQNAELAFSDLPDMYIGSAKVMDSAQTAQDVGGLGNLTASGLIKTTNYLQGTRLILADGVYLEYDSASQGVKLVGAGLWTESYLTAGGEGSSSGGGGGIDIDRLWQSLTNNPADQGYENTKIAIAHIPALPISGVIGLQSALDGKQATISDLATIRTNAANGNTAYSWGNHASAGYLTSANGVTISQALQSLQSQVDSVATRDTFDELTATAFYADMAAVSILYAGAISLGGADLAGSLSSLSSRATSLEGRATALEGRASTLEGYFSSGSAKSALRLTTVSKTAWGQTYWTSGGVPDSISGNMSSVGSISMNGSISGATSITASGLVKTTNYLQGTRLILADGVYLEYDSASQGVKLVGAGFWTESYVTAGGDGSSSGGGGIDIDRLWQSLTNNPADQGYENTKIAQAHIPDMATTYGYLKTITGAMVAAALGYTPFNNASFTKANIKSTLGISDWALASTKPGYSVSEISGLQAALNAKQDTISDLATIRSNAANGATAYGWGNHANAGYLTSANGTTISAALQSLQAQIDSVATRDMFDELKASALYADMASVSNLYVGTVSLNGADLAGTLSSLSSRASSLEGRASTLEGYFTGGVANSAAKLTTVSKTAWGQTYWTSGGVPDSISGNMSSVGSISMNGSISGATSITASGLVKTTNYLQGARLILADGVYLEYDSASQGVKLVGAGLWTESYLTAGGVGSGGGGGDMDIDRMWQSLTNNPADAGYENTKIAAAHIPDMATTYGYLKGNQTITLTGVVTGSGTTSIATSIADGALTIAKVSGLQAALDSKTGNTGTVTSVGLSVPTGLSVSGSPVTASGTLAISLASGYSIPTTAQQSAWSGKQDAIGDLETIRANAANGNTAYSWGNHASAGYLTSANGATISQAIQSLQSQIDSVASRDMFDELTATVLHSDIVTASNAYFDAITAASANIASITGSLSGNATTASYLVSASYGIGGGLNPIYFSDGRPVASTSTAGSASVPVYLNGGTLTAITPSSLFSALSSSVATNLSVTIAGQGRTIADLYARYDKDGGEIAPNMTTIGTALRSLQSQVDSVATRNAFDDLTATVLFTDMLSVGADALVGGLATVAGGIKLTTTKKIWFNDTVYIELDSNGHLHTNAGFYSDSFVTSGV